MPFTLTIRERNHSWAGRAPVTSRHDSRDAAVAELLEYVRRNWDAELGTEPPADSASMVAEYFADVGRERAPEHQTAGATLKRISLWVPERP